MIRISIHAPLAGSNIGFAVVVKLYQNFNPRSPRGEQQFLCLPIFHYDQISIHAPLAGSNEWKERLEEFYAISIHAPLAGSNLSTHAAHLIP